MRQVALIIVTLVLLPSCGVFRAKPVAVTDNREQLLALHEKALRAHREQNVAALLEDETDEYVLGNRGEIQRPSRAEREQMLGPYLRRTRFSSYEDTADPIVTVAKDGSLGWVVARVTARGKQETPSGIHDVEFTSVWIELYEKRSGRWVRTGNVSNFK
jgi:hypothetical protein